MRIALVGLGYWGEKLLRNLLTLVGPQQVVVVDQRRELALSTAERYPGTVFARSLDDALAHDVEGVIIATPAETHADLARRVLMAGRHVLVEKPLAASSDDAHAVAVLAEELGLTAMVGHTFLFSPRLEVVTSALHKSQIGSVDYVTSSRLNLGPYRTDINVIWDLASHDFSIIFHLLGEFPLWVQTTARAWVRPDVPDVAFMHLTFPSGVIASVVVSWAAPRKVRTVTLVGELGMIVYDDTHGDEPVKICDGGVVSSESASFGENQLTFRHGDTVAPHVAAHEPLFLELSHFLACIESGGPCISDAWFGLEVVKALEAADRSRQEGGRAVEVKAPAGSI